MKRFAGLCFLIGCVGDFPPPPEQQVMFDGGAEAGADACGAVIELCNGHDDDCDGRADEEQPDRPCPGALGVCAGAVSVCRGAEGYSTCDPVAHAMALDLGYVAEETPPLCNGRDEDCDGTADEGCECVVDETRPCGLDVGECQHGVQGCVEGRWAACEGGVGPVEEVCDAADQDCDGMNDEGVLNACGACGTVPHEACNTQDDDCDGTTDEGVLNACGSCGAVPVESCNEVDDDCDGTTDEGVKNPCGQCGTPPPEMCNGLDDDCDGATDEAPEVCNGTDDDCDGVIDELPPRPCDLCNQLPCRPGRLLCQGGRDTCEG